MPLMVHDLTGWFYPGCRVFSACEETVASPNAELRMQNAELYAADGGGTRFLHFADATVEMTDM